MTTSFVYPVWLTRLLVAAVIAVITVNLIQIQRCDLGGVLAANLVFGRTLRNYRTVATTASQLLSADDLESLPIQDTGAACY
jgi:hypothetical protein